LPQPARSPPRFIPTGAEISNSLRLRCPELSWVSLIAEKDVLFDPADVALFGAKAIVAKANDDADLIEEFRHGEVTFDVIVRQSKIISMRPNSSIHTNPLGNPRNARYYTSETTLYKTAVRPSN
jgi:hypothetical protein